MLKYVIRLGLVLGSLGCATPQRPNTPTPNSPDPYAKELAQLREAVSKLENKVGHLESEISAASAEEELTTMTIDSVKWASKDEINLVGNGPQHVLLCHVVEWKGFGKMLRFTRMADPHFVFEADGRPAVPAGMGTGGICNDNGSPRFVILAPYGDLDPRTTYHLRAANKKPGYQWVVASDLTVVSAEAER